MVYIGTTLDINGCSEGIKSRGIDNYIRSMYHVFLFLFSFFFHLVYILILLYFFCSVVVSGLFVRFRGRRHA